MTQILLGYELGTGKPVRVPLKHMMVTGITQEAGKTTTLEAMIERSGLKALTFITKRGEGAFKGARPIRPYFREQADWQFVAAILEASRGEKLKFERAWIIRASKGAKTLADVQRNVQREMVESKNALSRDVYLTLDAYLEVVVPEIGKVKWAPAVELQPGVNAMDLTGLSLELQHLVIKSSLDFVLKTETDTVVVVPEAWKYIPNSRGTPVKLAAEAYIRQGAGLRNYLWLDSQDIAGVEPLILKSVPLWLLGVQREINEIKRTLNYIPGPGKPKAVDVAQLGLGQFIVCWGVHTYQTYVMPAWMSESEAQAIASLGKEPPARPTVEMAGPAPDDVDEPAAEEADEMSAETEQKILEVLNRIDRKLDQQSQRATAVAAKAMSGGLGAPIPAPAPDQFGPVGDEEALYQRFKARLAAEAPQLIELLALGTEIHVRHEQKVIEVDTTTLRGQVLLLVADGLFDEWFTGTAATTELAKRGNRQPEPNVYRVLNDLVKDGVLQKKDRQGFKRVDGVKIVRKGK